MIRSLYSGVSGLTTHQTRMDVIGNNIANVNTYGYKTMRATFRDIYYQTAVSPTSGKVSYAGNNPSEVGYGVQLGSIDKDMSQSNGQSTNRTYDMMINGDGFFMTATFNGENISADLRTRELLFTRMGNFGIDSYGNLVTADNRFVIGSRNSLHGLRNVGTISENALADVQVKDRNGDDHINSSDITFRNTINMNELVQTAYNVFTDEYGYMYGYDWNAIVTAEGNRTGNKHVVYDFDGTDAEWGALTVEQKMEYVNLQDTIRNLNDDAGAVAAANYRYYCDKTGAEIKDTTGARISYATPYAAMVAATDDAGLEAAKATANTAGALQGELTYSDVGAVTVGKDGTISVTYNGDLKYLARIELAVFDNPDGLNEAGGTNFELSTASGDARIKNPDSEGAGQVKNKFLEMSNVNLANEFSDMIVTQRGYQANARMITTSDSMLEELVNLKR
ncbi:MAG: flagellar hook-basal body complex protein [Oscillospiraceae bacterium]|nr:flagellar hook-basal body complex protein [Oscillospiraceae bacterium]